MANALKLSLYIKVGPFCGNPILAYKLCNHVASHAVSERHTYSAAVVDREIIFCFLDPQVIAPLAEINP